MKILIINDAQDTGVKYQEKMNAYSEIECLYTAHAFDEAYNLLKSVEPDAVIFHVSKVTEKVMLMLEHIKRLAKEHVFITITHPGIKAGICRLRSRGVQYICGENEPFFSVDIVFSTILQSSCYHSGEKALSQMEQSGKILETKCLKYIRSYMEKIEFSEFSRGRFMCEDAILYAAKHLPGKINISTELYVHVAKLHHTTPGNVERQIRNCIEYVWRTRSVESIKKLYRYYYNEDIGRPTNGDFILNVAQIVRQPSRLLGKSQYSERELAYKWNCEFLPTGSPMIDQLLMEYRRECMFRGVLMDVVVFADCAYLSELEGVSWQDCKQIFAQLYQSVSSISSKVPLKTHMLYCLGYNKDCNYEIGVFIRRMPYDKGSLATAINFNTDRVQIHQKISGLLATVYNYKASVVLETSIKQGAFYGMGLRVIFDGKNEIEL